MRSIQYLLLFIISLSSAVSAADPKQKLNIPDERSWDKPARFTVTDRIWPAVHGEADVCMYANDALAAINFSIDDDYVQDHEWWLRTMEHYGWTMTWFLIVAYVEDGHSGFHGNWDTYRRLDSLGHNIASHTWSHGHCNDPYDGGYSTLGCPAILTGGSCCDADFEYAEEQRLIRENIPGDHCWTQAYSGHQVEDRTETVAGTTFTYDSYSHDYGIASKYYIGCRGVTGNPNMPHRANYMSTSIGDYSPAGIDRILDPATLHYYRGFICKFWHSKGDTAALLQNFDYIKAKESAGELWVGSYEDVLKYAQSWVTRELTVLDVTDSMVAFTLSDSMRDSIYTYPLTVKVRVNNDWDTVLAYQAGQPVEAVLVSHDSDKYALVKAVPDGGEVQITKGTGTVVTRVKTPSISPDGGNFTGRVSITLATATPGATVYYTTDGNDPTAGSAEYTAPFDLTASATVKAIGIMGGKEDSDIASASFTVVADTDAPSLVSAAGADDPNLIILTFSEAVDASDAEDTGNYTVPGVTVQNASLGTDNMTVSLTVTDMAVDQAYTVTVGSMRDRAVTPNTATGLQAMFTYTESQALEGQTAYWSMNNLDGSTVADEIGSNDGTAYNLDWTANGHDGGALYFNGYDTLDVGKSDFGADATHDLTVSLWFKADALGGFLVEKGPYVRPYHLQIYSGKLRCIVRTGGTNYVTGTTSLATDTWYHAVLTVDSTDAVLYLNNAVDRSYTLSGVMDNGTGQFTYIGTGFDGIIDEVRIWNRALNAAEVDGLFNYSPMSGITVPVDGKPLFSVNGEPAYFDTQGRRVGADAKGVVIRVDGDGIRKILKF